jgi:hypothetical protein
MFALPVRLRAQLAGFLRDRRSLLFSPGRHAPFGLTGFRITARLLAAGEVMIETVAASARSLTARQPTRPSIRGQRDFPLPFGASRRPACTLFGVRQSSDGEPARPAIHRAPRDTISRASYAFRRPAAIASATTPGRRDSGPGPVGLPSAARVWPYTGSRTSTPRSRAAWAPRLIQSAIPVAADGPRIYLRRTSYVPETSQMPSLPPRARPASASPFPAREP